MKFNITKKWVEELMKEEKEYLKEFKDTDISIEKQKHILSLWLERDIGDDKDFD